MWRNPSFFSSFIHSVFWLIIKIKCLLIVCKKNLLKFHICPNGIECFFFHFSSNHIKWHFYIITEKFVSSGWNFFEMMNIMMLCACACVFLLNRLCLCSFKFNSFAICRFRSVFFNINFHTVHLVVNFLVGAPSLVIFLLLKTHFWFHLCSSCLHRHRQKTHTQQLFNICHWNHWNELLLGFEFRIKHFPFDGTMWMRVTTFQRQITSYHKRKERRKEKEMRIAF